MRTWLSVFLLACGSDPKPASTVDAPPAVFDAAPPPTVTEKLVTVDLALTGTQLVITAHDGSTPVITDLWLYNGDKTPLTGFTSTAARKSPDLMLPATANNHPSGLVPAADGRANGLMTNTKRGVLMNGTFMSTVDGKVTVTLAAAPTQPIVVIAGVEDQRYAGAAAINADGTAGTVPAGLGGTVETHNVRSYKDDVLPILQFRCGSCHKADMPPFSANFYLVTGTRDELVNDNFALKEATEDCEDANPAGAARDACIAAITKTEYLVEPGAPAVSDLLTRSRPDEMGDQSVQGLLWWGSKGARYNAEYGDRRMPSTVDDPDTTKWTHQPTDFDVHPEEFQVLYDWVAQGAPNN